MLSGNVKLNYIISLLNFQTAKDVDEQNKAIQVVNPGTRMTSQSLEVKELIEQRMAEKEGKTLDFALGMWHHFNSQIDDLIPSIETSNLVFKEFLRDLRLSRVYYKQLKIGRHFTFYSPFVEFRDIVPYLEDLEYSMERGEVKASALEYL